MQYIVLKNEINLKNISKHQNNRDIATGILPHPLPLLLKEKG
jgi:hypothetical protein